MKTLFVISFLSLIFSIHCSAQWKTSGSNIYFNTGKVGVNQTSPNQSLDVKALSHGDGISITGTNKSSSLRFYHNSNLMANIGLSIETSSYVPTAKKNDLVIENNWSSGDIVFGTDGDNERMRITNSGNVVILKNLILTSPNGTKWKLHIDNYGNITTCIFLSKTDTCSCSKRTLIPG